MEWGMVPNSRSGECTAFREIQSVAMYENGLHACTETRWSRPGDTIKENSR